MAQHVPDLAFSMIHSMLDGPDVSSMRLACRTLRDRADATTSALTIDLHDAEAPLLRRMANVTELTVDNRNTVVWNDWTRELLEALPLAKLQRLHARGIAHLPSQWIAERCPGLRDLQLAGCGVDALAPLVGLSRLTTLALDGVNLSEERLDLAPLARLERLQDLAVRSAIDVDVRALGSLTDLRRLTLVHSQVRNIGALSALKLEALDLRGTPLVNVDFLSGMTTLEWLAIDTDLLGVSGNDDGTLSLRYDASALRALDGLTGLKNLQVPAVPSAEWLSVFKKLEELHVGAAWDITSVASLPTTLHALSIPLAAGLEDASGFSGLTNLRALDIGFTSIENFAPMSKLVALTELRVYDTAVADLGAITSLTALVRLDIGVTRVADVAPLAALVGLRDLDVSHTCIRDFAPLAALQNLTRLVVAHTAFNDAAVLAPLAGLEILDVSYTNVTDLEPILHLTNLCHVNFEGTVFETFRAYN